MKEKTGNKITITTKNSEKEKKYKKIQTKNEQTRKFI